MLDFATLMQPTGIDVASEVTSPAGGGTIAEGQAAKAT